MPQENQFEGLLDPNTQFKLLKMPPGLYVKRHGGSRCKVGTILQAMPQQVFYLNT